MSPIDRLPPELFFSAFLYLGLEDLASCQRVSRGWKEHVALQVECRARHLGDEVQVGLKNWSWKVIDPQTMTLPRLAYLTRTSFPTHSLFYNPHVPKSSSFERLWTLNNFPPEWGGYSSALCAIEWIDQLGRVFVRSIDCQLLGFDPRTFDEKNKDHAFFCAFRGERGVALDQKGRFFTGDRYFIHLKAYDQQSLDAKEPTPIWKYGRSDGDMDYDGAIDRLGRLIITNRSVNMGHRGGIYRFQLNRVNRNQPEPELTYLVDSYEKFSPVVIDKQGSVFFGSIHGVFYALDSSFNQLWSFQSQGRFISTPGINLYGNIIAVTTNGYVYCFSPDQDSPIYDFHTEKDIHEEASPAIDQEGRVFIGSGHVFYAFDHKLQLLWSYSTKGRICASAAIDQHGRVFIGSMDGMLYAFDPKTIDSENPQPFWTFNTGDAIFSPPAFDPEGRLWIASNDTKIYAFKPVEN